MSDERFEAWLTSTARGFVYPQPPPLHLHPAIRRPARRLAWALALLLGVLIVALAIPPVRAAVRDLLQIGAVQVELGGATPTAALSQGPLGAETTLAEAENKLGVSITLPESLETPDRVLQQEFGSTRAAILVWRDPDLSLHLITDPDLTFRFIKSVERIEQVSLHGREAYWIAEPHVLAVGEQDLLTQRVVEGNVLIWMWGRFTLRLETVLDKAQALLMAEQIGIQGRVP